MMVYKTGWKLIMYLELIVAFQNDYSIIYYIINCTCFFVILFLVRKSVKIYRVKQKEVVENGAGRLFEANFFCPEQFENTDVRNI